MVVTVVDDELAFVCWIATTSINQSINQPTNQLINHLMSAKCCVVWLWFSTEAGSALSVTSVLIAGSNLLH